MQTMLDCSRIEGSDLVERYVASRLPEALATEFEAHYFGCDACWERVRRATELRAAFDEVRAVPGPDPDREATIRPRLPSLRRPSLAVAVAAALAAVALGVGLWATTRGSGPPAGPDTLRGGSEVLSLVTGATAGELDVRWPAIDGADTYRVRLFAANGGVVLERTLADTAVSVTEAVAAGAAGPLYWQVDAYDAVRRRIAGSAPTPARPR